MVSFSCHACQDTVKKPKLDAHYNKCYSGFDCIDCAKSFHSPAEFRQHTSCISEAEKYEKSMYRGPRTGSGFNRGGYGGGRGGRGGGPSWIRTPATGPNETPLGTPNRMSPVTTPAAAVPEVPAAPVASPATKEEKKKEKKERKDKTSPAEPQPQSADEPSKKSTKKRKRDESDVAAVPVLLVEKKQKKDKKEKKSDGGARRGTDGGGRGGGGGGKGREEEAEKRVEGEGEGWGNSRGRIGGWEEGE
ncbi:hypothetical protein C8F01DRAFT_223764 [Mycena amicta]|nr:hypothetical protein C8F01DRAFT_223764 [Mycena amicta]